MQLYNLFQQYPIICTDSRNCPDGSLFFALKGDNFNANAFALLALENGCAFAIVDDEKYAIDERFILVDNVLTSLQELANYHRLQLRTKIIGITGTNGKTTTKELIAAVLKEKYNILYTQGNLNNHIGVPLTLLKLKPEHQIAVIEMGANHVGEIKTLVEIVCPDYAIITNVGKAHLEGFGSFEGVMKAKAEMYDYMAELGKNIFLNFDNDFLINMAHKSGINIEKSITYTQKSVNNKCAVYGEAVISSPFLTIKFKIGKSEYETIKSNLIGAYNTENVLAAVTIGNFFGLENVQIRNGIEKYIPENNRSQFTQTDKNKLIVDAYNANPTSMHAAIENFALLNALNKTLILGDMLELGYQSQIEHQSIVKLLENKGFKNVILVGPEFNKIKSNFLNFIHIVDVMKYIDNNAIEDQHILIKGSRGIKLELVISKL